MEFNEDASRSEIREVAHAFNEGWPIDGDKRSLIVDVLMNIINDPTKSDRTKNAAITAFLAAERNQLAKQELEHKINQANGGATDDNLIKLAGEIKIIRGE